MKNLHRALVVLAVSSVTSAASADEVVRIEVGKDYSSCSHSELQRRVWALENAVWQLQRRVFQLEAGSPTPPAAAESWVCTVRARGDTFTGVGATKAVATHKAIDACKQKNDGSAFFCSKPTCEQ